VALEAEGKDAQGTINKAKAKTDLVRAVMVKKVDHRAASGRDVDVAATAATIVVHIVADRVKAAPMKNMAAMVRMRAVVADPQGASSAETIVAAVEAGGHARRTARQNKVVKRDLVDHRVPASADAVLDVLVAKTHSLNLPTKQRLIMIMDQLSLKIASLCRILLLKVQLRSLYAQQQPTKNTNFNKTSTIININNTKIKKTQKSITIISIMFKNTTKKPTY
jgi:hypothetical protein